ncbi:MAG TPA: RNA polymerase sigma factor [Caulobacteraceae bacterium]|jgi:RNA polymerase sigma-70 factor (ECF subfamily)
MAARSAIALDYAGLDEAALARLAKAGDHEAFRAVMQRYNQRLFRMARSIMRDDSEAEDVLQEAYVRAFSAIGRFREDSSLLTWLTRIVINEARGRLRRRRPTVGLEMFETDDDDAIVPFARPVPASPEADAARAEARRLMETAIDELPEPFRLVFILRELEECSVDETAERLGILPETVKTRLFRARKLLRRALEEKLMSSLADAFPFLGARCERITEAVLARLGPPKP